MKSRRTTYVLLVVAIVLIVWAMIAGDDPLGPLGPLAERLPSVWQAVSLIVLLPLMLLSMFGFQIGTAILALLALLAINRRNAAHPSRMEPLVVPVLSMIWLAAQALPFLRTPAGTAIRPMGWAGLMFMSALCLMVLSLVSTIRQFLKRGNTIQCWLAMLMSFGLVPVPFLSLYAVAWVAGLSFAD